MKIIGKTFMISALLCFFSSGCSSEPAAPLSDICCQGYCNAPKGTCCADDGTCNGNHIWLPPMQES